jgi:hypothetical protein
VPHDEFTALLHRWGVKHLFVWSRSSSAYLEEFGAVSKVWTDGVWREFVLDGADTRSVVTGRGSARLEDLTPTSGRVVLDDVPAGTRVVVRTHYYPAWSATLGGRPVTLESESGQLAFTTPADADGVVELEYDRRLWLSMAAIATLLSGLLLLTRL